MSRDVTCGGWCCKLDGSCFLRGGLCPRPSRHARDASPAPGSSDLGCRNTACSRFALHASLVGALAAAAPSLVAAPLNSPDDADSSQAPARCDADLVRA